ncbi:hypothetical protein [Botrimarina colliarenosi]|uniref:hypothetical protein n=1 Tax=Botrimarina colliarenosi TaxID=2528001 RepID=UPI0018D2BBE3|nr:hypothetical protein [Botrimarina colliarenosi]
MRNPRRGLTASAALALLFSASLGCNNGSPFAYVAASGSVHFEDGEPLTVGKVIFKPMAEAKGTAHPRAGGADLNSEGRFDSVTSYKPGDGLVPGKHKVAIMFAVDDKGNSLVDTDYTNIATTPLMVDTAETPFKIVVPRPAK